MKIPEHFKEWDSLPDKAYEFIFSQAKDRFEESLSESESITNKSIKFIIGLFGFMSAFIGIIACKPIPGLVVIFVAILFFTDAVILGKLIFPKNIIQRGSPPFEIFNTDLDNETFSDGDKIKNVYFNECLRYEDRISQMKEKNESRISIYKWAIWIFFSLLICVVLLFQVYVFHL